VKLAILIPTYRKGNGEFKDQLIQCLQSVSNQTYSNYRVYLIGDNYENNDEFLELSKIIDSSKIVAKNLPIAYERSKYSGRKLWVCGGVNASNIGIDLAINDGCSYICHLDHDDKWSSNHLQVISNAIDKTGANFISTRSGKGWPAMESTEYLTKWRPLPSKVFKSTTCLNYSHFKLRFRNMIEAENKVYASDADLWRRVNQQMIQNNEWGYVINESTLARLDSQFVIKNN
jgi:glycosyltransferase involved in cell wall biosynthesis